MTLEEIGHSFVSTRYQGSKRRIAPWILEKTQRLKYQSVLDGFSGTCSVAYEFKKNGKQVTCSDLLKSNYFVAKALVENSGQRLNDKEVEFVLKKHNNISYSRFVQRTFKGIYYKEKENRWLDIVIRNIQEIVNPYKKAIALFALFQSCLIKRPFNLFHRKNLYLRVNHVERTFHNHITWEERFENYFRRFVMEANSCIFSNGFRNRAWNLDVLDIEDTNFDLAYFDPPYISPGGQGMDYHHFYHFLEGLCDYDGWGDRIDYESKHLRLKNEPNIWTKKGTIIRAFEQLFEKFQDSIMIVSYRSPGFPSKSLLKTILEQYKKEVVVHSKPRKYALSKRKRNFEILLIGE